MLPDRVSNPGPLTYESGALPIALRGLANIVFSKAIYEHYFQCQNDRHLFSTYGKYKKKRRKCATV